MAELQVYLHDRLLGSIARSRGRRGEVVFSVDGAWAGGPDALTEAFALTPGETIDAAAATSFFGGYAPEGEHRRLIAERRRFDPYDLFEWLSRYGLTMAGALSIRTDAPEDARPGTYRPLSEREVVRKLEQEQRDFDLGNEPDSGRSMLPGFQPKLLIARFGDQWYQPEHRAHSTHILKPAPKARPATIANEFFSHELSRHMGLTTFGSELITYNQKTFLAIERYDRVVEGESVRAVHQEDAAQALGLDWVDSAVKFQSPERPRDRKRPSARRIAELMGSFGDGSDAEVWLRYLVYAVLIGNHDAHAKNVSIIHDAGGSRIAPMYDAVPILHINDDPSRVGDRRISDDLSLAIDGTFSHHSVTVEDFVSEAAGWGAFTAGRAEEIVAGTLDAFAAALDATSAPPGATAGLKDRLGYNHDRLAAAVAVVGLGGCRGHPRRRA